MFDKNNKYVREFNNNSFVKWLKRVGPAYNFLTVHCTSLPQFRCIRVRLMVDIYIISSTLFGSLMIYAGRDISYINALVFSAGSCTQAGLNPIDVNLLNTWQQVRPLFVGGKSNL
jgi:hypothetical protein